MPSLDSILKIPGNETVYRVLRERIAAKSLTAFLGAGCSAPLYPLWRELIEALADEAVRLGLAKAADKAYWVRNADTKPLHIAAQIRSKLGEARWNPFLYETFKDRTGPDGKTYTPVQGLLARTSLKAILTTNYDPGILEARREFQPSIRQTGFAVWNQSSPIQQWSSGDLFQDDQYLPILYAHGHFADAESIVLDHMSYQKAYRNTPYRRLFENLWFQHHLLFVGFSFNDATMNQIADEVLSVMARPTQSSPRHVTILGVPTTHEYSEEIRKEYVVRFNSDVLFYPILTGEAGKPDHSCLQVLLDSLLQPEQTRAIHKPQEVASTSGQKIESCFEHETTEDEEFTGRDTELARLDSWAKDTDVRVVAISAIGGLGKTSLTGQWLRTGRAAHALEASAVFFWSFYRDNESKNLIQALLRFGTEKLKWKPPKQSDIIRQALHLLTVKRIAVVLDGLEVVQESPGTVAFGKVLQVELAELLHGHCSSAARSLIVLTSRFPFPDLTPYLGGALRPLPLPSLDAKSGAKLLWSLGVRGAESDREQVSVKFRGHPLGLRIFARSMPKEFGGDPTRLWQRIFDQAHLTVDDSLESKLRRLLKFYQERLPESHSRALSLVALFRMPVGEPVLAPLWDKLFQKKRATSSLHRTLDELHAEHLLTADQSDGRHPQYTCHPILRDHFRAEVLQNEGFAKQAASLMADQPDSKDNSSTGAVAILATAIEALLEANEIKAADELYRTRLGDGKAFTRLLVPHLGLEVARYFVRDVVRQAQVAATIGQERLGNYLNAAGVFARNAGEPEAAYEFFGRAESLYAGMNNYDLLADARAKLAGVQISLGSMRIISLGAAHVSDAIETRTKCRSADVQRYAAYTAILQGDIAYADSLLEKAEKRAVKAVFDIEGIGAFAGAEYLLRRGNAQAADSLLRSLRKRLVDAKSSDQLARCDAILSRAALQQGKLPLSLQHLENAKKTFASAHMIYDLASLLVTEARYRMAGKNWSEASACLERALQLSAPRKYRLIQVDALNARSRLICESSKNMNSARDDAEAALILAEFCDYAWGQWEACTQLAVTLRELGDPEAGSYQGRASIWDHRLRSGEFQYW